MSVHDALRSQIMQLPLGVQHVDAHEYVHEVDAVPTARAAAAASLCLVMRASLGFF